MAERPIMQLPEWLENSDVGSVHNRMLATLPADIDSTEASFPWDFTRPSALIAAELLQSHVVETLRVMHPMWAYGEYLDYHGMGVGIERKPATCATGWVELTGDEGTSVPAGTAFAVPAVLDSPAAEFRTLADGEIGESGLLRLPVEAAEPGTRGNVGPGTISLASKPIPGVTGITNPERISGGTDEEDDDALYERVMGAIKAAEYSYIGNDSDYKRWAEEVAGVGKATVIPEAYGPGTVKLVLTDANGEPATDALVDSVYSHIISPEDRLARKAPIGASLTVVSPAGIAVEIVIGRICLHEGLEWSIVKARFHSHLQEYYKKQASEESVVRYTQIHAALAKTDGVTDFDGLMVNGGTQNIALSQDEYPVTLSENIRLLTEEAEVMEDEA